MRSVSKIVRWEQLSSSSGKTCGSFWVRQGSKLPSFLYSSSVQKLLHQFYDLLCISSTANQVGHSLRHRGGLEEGTADQHAVVPGLFRTGSPCSPVGIPELPHLLCEPAVSFETMVQGQIILHNAPQFLQGQRLERPGPKKCEDR